MPGELAHMARGGGRGRPMGGGARSGFGGGRRRGAEGRRGGWVKMKQIKKH